MKEVQGRVDNKWWNYKRVLSRYLLHMYNELSFTRSCLKLTCLMYLFIHICTNGENYIFPSNTILSKHPNVNKRNKARSTITAILLALVSTPSHHWGWHIFTAAQSNQTLLATKSLHDYMQRAKNTWKNQQKQQETQKAWQKWMEFNNMHHSIEERICRYPGIGIGSALALWAAQ